MRGACLVVLVIAHWDPVVLVDGADMWMEQICGRENEYGRVAAHLAAEWGKKTVLQYLIEAPTPQRGLTGLAGGVSICGMVWHGAVWHAVMPFMPLVKGIT